MQQSSLLLRIGNEQGGVMKVILGMVHLTPDQVRFQKPKTKTLLLDVRVRRRMPVITFYFQKCQGAYIKQYLPKRKSKISLCFLNFILCHQNGQNLRMPRTLFKELFTIYIPFWSIQKYIRMLPPPLVAFENVLKLHS